MKLIIKKILKYLLTKVINKIRFIENKFDHILLPDKLYLTYLFKKNIGKRINWKNPKTFNEKLQWLKLYDRRPEYSTYVDKYKVREYISKTIGEEYLIPLLGVWDNPDEIDFDKLPNQFVLKCNHDSGGLCICEEKSTFNIEACKEKLRKSLNTNYYMIAREWPYKNVPRKIIAEKYMVDESGYELKDYKIFNFNGEPKFIQVDFDRFVNHYRNLYTTDWRYIEAKIEFPTNPNRLIPRPNVLEVMLELAKKLSKGIPHVRTDFYCINNKVYFGEMTFYHGSGFEKFEPEKWDYILGNWIKLPN